MTRFVILAAAGLLVAPRARAQLCIAPTAPSAPGEPIAIAGNAQASLTWIAPAPNGSAITEYIVASNPPDVPGLHLMGTSGTVTGLTNGRAYTFTVSAANGCGSGPASPPSTAVKPTAPIAAPPGPALWVNISPPVNFTYQALVNYGMQAIDGAAADAPKTLYAGTCGFGIWKTIDGGDSWAHVSTGTNGAALGNGTSGSARNWSLAVDPTDSKVVYTVSGFGANGLWKSVDGGVDWTQLLPAAVSAVATNDVTNVTLDPNNHQHLLVASHSNWPGYNASGLLESTDGGASWRTIPPQAWGTGPIVAFLGRDDAGKPSSSHWLVGAGLGGSGTWRTTDSGASWTMVYGQGRSHAGLGLYRAGNGTIYLGLDNRVVRSTDNGVTWRSANAPGGPDAYGGLAGDGTNIWGMLGNTGVGCCGPYHWSITRESDGATWTQYNAQTFADGPGWMIFDRVNRILYSSQWGSGLWRLKLP